MIVPASGVSRARNLDGDSNTLYLYTASSMSGEDEPDLALRFATRVVKMALF